MKADDILSNIELQSTYESFCGARGVMISTEKSVVDTMPSHSIEPP